jgi:hypothetical protein
MVRAVFGSVPVFIPETKHLPRLRRRQLLDF